ncbi:MAG: NADH-quinone oxidoreductase subunit NuoE [Ignavibacteriales bacterium]|nr:NADH-quinone oxidoreductase subunit NuoE [Ignavibacteriales bacterium]
MFTEENLKKIEELKKKYPTTQALVLPVLWMAQEQFGHISNDTMKYVAQLLNVPYGHILGVVTFYTMYHSKPIGKHHIEVCTNVSCMLRGSAKIVEHLEHRLGVEIGQTSPDMKWTLSEVECMGSCGTAPMFAIGEEYYENLSTEKVDKILSELT